MSVLGAIIMWGFLVGSREGIWLYKETKHGVGEKEGEKLVYFNVTVRKFM